MKLATALLAIATFATGGLLTATGFVLAQPHCPTEDSCSIDYQHGKGWVVTEVQP